MRAQDLNAEIGAKILPATQFTSDSHVGLIAL